MADVCPINELGKILLATDGSEFSGCAEKEAVSLSKECSSKLVAISVVEANEEYASEAPQMVEKAEAEAAASLELVKAAAGAAGVDCTTEVHTGDSPFRIIVDEARKNDSELIVMGRRGRTGLAKVAMGSVTARVVGHAPCDVLIVPRGCSLEFKNIFVATDGSGHGEGAAIEAIKMAKKVDGAITAFSVASSEAKLPEASQNVASVKQMADAEGIACETVTAVGKTYQQIVDQAAERKADLIVIGCHGKGGLGTLLMGSVTERVVGHAKCAVMVACKA